MNTDIMDYNRIKDIYNKFIKPKNNLNYFKGIDQNNLNNIFSKAIDWNFKGKDFSRIVSLYEFSNFFKRYDMTFENACIFNGNNDPEINFLKYKNIFKYSYTPENIKTDLHHLNLKQKNFDFFMVNQSLEHVYNPCLVLKNINQHMKKNGLIYMNIPCNSIPHDTPHHHYTGFTPVALGCIIEQAGFEILDIGFWGNSEYLLKMIKYNSWPEYRDLVTYDNESNYPIIAWIFGRKQYE